MKILWFTSTPSKYKNSKTSYNGRGWIESLETLITEDKNIDLAISFFHDDEIFKIKEGNTTYYPIPLYNTLTKKIKHNLFYKNYDSKEIDYCLKVVNDFQPDVIHIFGTESSFGLLSKLTNIPVVIHIQGILNPCLNAYFPPALSMFQIVKLNLLKPKTAFNILKTFSFFNYNVKRELEILKTSSNFMGRTTWDRNISKLYSPKSSYFYCSEVLRDLFYESNPWQYKASEKIIFVSTISQTIYKGFDLILKTAKLLKEETSLDFEWKVFGVTECVEWEKILGIKCINVNINLMGVADSKILAENIVDANIFIHPTYIDNSPNSICEAQILGIPIISTNVGGISSLIENGVTGYLVPSNDPFTLAAQIIEIIENPEMTKVISENGRNVASMRHNRETIKYDIMHCYDQLIKANI